MLPSHYLWKSHVAATSIECDIFPRDIAGMVAEFALTGCVEVPMDHLADPGPISSFGVCDSELWVVDSRRHIVRAPVGIVDVQMGRPAILLPVSKRKALILTKTLWSGKMTCYEVSQEGTKEIWSMSTSANVLMSYGAIAITVSPPFGACVHFQMLESVRSMQVHRADVGDRVHTRSPTSHPVLSLLVPIDQDTYLDVDKDYGTVHSMQKCEPVARWPMPLQAADVPSYQDDCCVLARAGCLVALSRTMLCVHVVDFRTGLLTRTIALHGACSRSKCLTVDRVTEMLYVYETNPLRVWACL